ncbi:MAG: SDR family oxidoreductase [Acidobacteriia bacterium]|nr:SDR family oxidoreductase [Terriglobia bacterium]
MAVLFGWSKSGDFSIVEAQMKMTISSPILKDKVAVVTGASRGIGRAIAQAFAREAATVVICGRKQETLDQVAAEMAGNPGTFYPLACHVGRADQIQRLVETCNRQFGRIDILVNNAATNIAQEPVLQIDEGKFDKMVEVNLKSAFRLMQAIAPGMCERGWGSIVNIASIAGIRPQYHGMLYSMTKAALIMMTQSYALELGPRGVRVNAIAPGMIQTVLSEYYWKDDAKREKIMEEQPIKHLGQPEEIAEMALLLASERGSYITGQTLIVDGGRLLP